MYRLGDSYAKQLQQELNEVKEPEETYYYMNFTTKLGEGNPLKLRNFMSDKCNQKVEEITNNKKLFSFNVETNEELNQLSEIKKV